jgi:TorA maturation chaperone TorD
VPPTDTIALAIDVSFDRARVYGALAQLFRPPDAGLVESARDRSLPGLLDALDRLPGHSHLAAEARALCGFLADAPVERLRKGHHAAFDESSAERCAPNEMDQLDGAPQLELTRTFEMADVAGFYKAFGVQVASDGERPDHIAAELEFMNLLAVKECIALQDEGPGEHAEVCHDASRAFLRDHLGRFAPRLGEALAKGSEEPVYRSAGRLLADFIALDAEQIDAANAPVHRLTPERRDAPAPS